MQQFQELKRICITLLLSASRIKLLTQLLSGSMVALDVRPCLGSFKSMAHTHSLMELLASLLIHTHGTKRLMLFTLKALLALVSQLAEILLNANGMTSILLMITFKHSLP
jgi:hypothetical protein